MNFDVNTISTLIKTFSSINGQQNESHAAENQAHRAPSQSQRAQNASYNDAKRSTMAFGDRDEYRFNISPFVSQNGIGEQIDDVVHAFSTKNDAESAQEQNDSGAFESILKAFANQTSQEQSSMLPLFEIIKGMASNKKGDISSLLPMIMSLMQSKSQQTFKKEGAQDKSQSTNHANDKIDNKKTQPLGKYSPIAFAGYPTLCALHKLVSACYTR